MKIDNRQYHAPQGDPCLKCGLPSSLHRGGKRASHDNRLRPGRNQKDYRDEAERVNYIGIDGEGQGRATHNYVLLAACAENGDNWWVKPHPGNDRLTTEQCLDMILELPTAHTKIFSYSFNYDLTKMLTDLSDDALYHLFRPELRQRLKQPEKGPWPVRWGKYRLNLQGTKFTVYANNPETGKQKRVVIWDLFRFFGCKFTQALKDWKIGSPEFIAEMELMKDKRAEFDKVSPEKVRQYCFDECKAMAELGHKLIDAHRGAELVLKSYYGAGSSGGAMLTAMNIMEKLVEPIEPMREPIASAFFGGRFENSVVGTVSGAVQSYDISSAYPYQLYFLPCLEHGTWTETTNRAEVESSRTALIQYGLAETAESYKMTWGPFPYRTPDGSITYPSSSGGGWVWKDEYLAGEKFAKNVFFKKAWVYKCDCKCRPFAKIAEYYVLRRKLGKEGPGIVIKLGCNSCYGKLAQSVGNAPFNNWIWAGLITAGCRAQLLELMMLHKDRSNALMVATDGLYTREKLIPPAPLETGTGMEMHGKKIPLGGWEHKEHGEGVFVARPGIYFPLNPTKEQLKDIRARGVGKGVVLESWKHIIQSWDEHGVDKPVSIGNVSRFCGAKTCVSHGKDGFKRANASDGKAPSFGQWITRKIEMSFNPLPKRECVNRDGQTLALRRFPQFIMSKPYARAMREKGKIVLSPDALMMKMAFHEMSEQPDFDLSDYEPDAET